MPNNHGVRLNSARIDFSGGTAVVVLEIHTRMGEYYGDLILEAQGIRWRPKHAHYNKRPIVDWSLLLGLFVGRSSDSRRA